MTGFHTAYFFFELFFAGISLQENELETSFSLDLSPQPRDT